MNEKACILAQKIAKKLSLLRESNERSEHSENCGGFGKSSDFMTKNYISSRRKQMFQKFDDIFKILGHSSPILRLFRKSFPQKFEILAQKSQKIKLHKNLTGD